MVATDVGPDNQQNTTRNPGTLEQEASPSAETRTGPQRLEQTSAPASSATYFRAPQPFCGSLLCLEYGKSCVIFPTKQNSSRTATLLVIVPQLAQG